MEPCDTKQPTPEVEAVENLTPHDIHIFGADGTTLVHTFPRAAKTVRALESRPEPLRTLVVPATTTTHKNAICVPVYRNPRYAGLTDLPPNDGRAVIVSALAAEELSKPGPRRWKGAVYSPNSGPLSVVRAEDGSIRGVRSLFQWN